jgi:hypothetical protein
MVVLGEKLGDRPVDRPADVLRIVSGALFLRSSMIHPTLLGQREMLVHMGTARMKCTWTGAEMYVSCISGFPCRMYIDSNRRDSRI